MLALRITSPEAPVAVEITAGEICAGRGPAIYLLRSTQIEECRSDKRRFLNRGGKHPRRDLASYFLAAPLGKVPVLSAAYKNTGQLRKSASAFLRRARNKGLAPVCVLGVPDAIFERLLEESKRPPGSGPPASQSFMDLFGYDPAELALASSIQGNSPQITEVRLKVLAAAVGEFPVLITGPTGSGKTHIARIIHERGARSPVRKGRFVEINCASIPSELLESELFGHRKGSFSGALHDKPGLWEDAGSGTLFLDEIGDLRPDHQAKVLQALQGGSIRRIGDTREIPVYARIVAATNRSLELLLRDGIFREDLYYRLSGFSIDIPPLDQHADDIPLLANHFWTVVAPNAPPLSSAVVAYLHSVRWPGNVRMLRRCLEVAHGLIPPGATPAVSQIEYVLRSFSPVLPDSDPPESDRAAKQYLSDCVIHLRRLSAVMERLRRAADGPAARLRVLRGELESLLRNRLLFHSVELERQTTLLAQQMASQLSEDGGTRDLLLRKLSRLEKLAARELKETVEQLEEGFSG
jgi:DNA-binding NtrC family response regulator